MNTMIDKTTLIILLFLILAACSSTEPMPTVVSDTEQPTDVALTQVEQSTDVDPTPILTDAPPTALPPTPTPTPIPPTPTPATHWTMQWEIPIGQMLPNTIHAMPDGQVIGLAMLDDGTTKHITISDDGEIIQTVDIEPPCAADIHLIDDGRIVCTGFDGDETSSGTLIIQPDGTYEQSSLPTIPAGSDSTTVITPKGAVITNNLVFGSVNYDYQLRSFLDSTKLERYEIEKARVFDSPYGVIAIDKATDELYFFDINGQLAYQGIVEGVDRDAQIATRSIVTPHGDAWIRLAARDEIGNQTGWRVLRISPDGTLEDMSHLDHLQDDRWFAAGEDLPSMPSNATRPIDRLRAFSVVEDLWFCVCIRGVAAIDRDLQVVDYIPFDGTMPRQPNATGLGMIGQDGNLYTVVDNVLTKYRSNR